LRSSADIARRTGHIRFVVVIANLPEIFRVVPAFRGTTEDYAFAGATTSRDALRENHIRQQTKLRHCLIMGNTLVPA
jgi:hypothetical protein